MKLLKQLPFFILVLQLHVSSFQSKSVSIKLFQGLSLSYDILKALGGEINVETKEGRGTEFIIWLPGARYDSKT